MSTRGLYTFKAGHDAPYDQDWNVYRHSDNYPSGAAQVLEIAQKWFAWTEGRYESDAFAAAFIAAGKAWWLDRFLKEDDITPDIKEIEETLAGYGPKGKYRGFNGGGVRLMPQGDPTKVAQEHCSDIEYRYEISQFTIKPHKLRVQCFEGKWWTTDDRPNLREVLLIDSALEDFPARVQFYEKNKNKQIVIKRAAKKEPATV